MQLDSKFDEAYEYLQKALVINKNTFGEESDEVALIYGKIGMHFMITGNFKESLKYHFMRKDLIAKVSGKNNLSYAEALTDIGTMYTK